MPYDFITTRWNINPKLVAEITGHSTVKTLLDMYSRVTPPASRSATSIVSTAIQEAEEELNEENWDTDDHEDDQL